MPGNHYPIVSLDVEVNIFHDLYLTKRKRWATVARVTDEPGPSTAKLYTHKGSLALDFPSHSPFYKWGTQFFSQQPMPRELLYIPVPRTAGRPATDYADALDNHKRIYGVDFYQLTGHVRSAAEWKAVVDWAKATGHLDATVAQMTNVMGEPAYHQIVTTRQVQTLTIDATLITGNVISVEFDGVTVSQLYATSNDDTMEAFALALEALDNVKTAVASDVGAVGFKNTITITTERIFADIAITDPIVTGGASQADVALAETVAAAGLAIHSRFQGEKGEYDKVEVAIADDPNDPGNPLKSATLDVQRTALANLGSKIIIRPATDGTATITSTLAQVGARINADPDSSFLFFAEVIGNGAALIAEAAATALVDGARNPDFYYDSVNDEVVVQDVIDRGALINSSRGAVWTHVRPSDEYTTVGNLNAIDLGTYPDSVVSAFAAVRNPGSFILDKKPVEGVANPCSRQLYGNMALDDTNLRDLRAGKINVVGWKSPIDQNIVVDDHTLGNMWQSIRMAIDVLTAWQIEAGWDVMTNPPGGVGKLAYYDDGFRTVVHEVVWKPLRRGMLPEWNFIGYDHRTKQPAARVTAPTYIQIMDTAPELAEQGHYPMVFYATVKDGIRSIQVTGYLTHEFIPTTLAAFNLLTA